MAKLPRQIRAIGVHMVCWAAYIIYELLINYFLSVPIVVSMAYFYACNIILFYVHAQILEQTFNRTKAAVGMGFVFMLLTLLIISLLKLFGDYWITSDQNSFFKINGILKQFIILDLSRSVLYIGLSTLYWYRGFSATLQQQKAKAVMLELRAERDKAELAANLADARNAYLQQQLNPHLMFNTLNFIYNAVYRSSEEGGKAVLLLADILNFSLRDPDENGKVGLKDELEQLGNLISINRYRYHFPLLIEYRVNGDAENHRILPLVLLTLTENMFKHGDFRNSPASIRIDVTPGGLLQFETKNTKKYLSAEGQPKGIGIRNIRLRLEHAYRDDFKMEISETHTDYQIGLSIKL